MFYVRQNFISVQHLSGLLILPVFWALRWKMGGFDGFQAPLNMTWSWRSAERHIDKLEKKIIFHPPLPFAEWTAQSFFLLSRKDQHRGFQTNVGQFWPLPLGKQVVLTTVLALQCYSGLSQRHQSRWFRGPDPHPFMPREYLLGRRRESERNGTEETRAPKFVRDWRRWIFSSITLSCN